MTVARPRRRPAGPIAVAVALVLAVGAISAAAVARLPACQFVPAEQCTRVLFIGNSYTSVNDLPGMVARLAASGGHPVETGMYAPAGAFLADDVGRPEVTAAITGTRWTAVVLQEQSQRPASAAGLGQFAAAASRLSATAMSVGARPYLLETWARREGWPELGMDATAMQRAIDQGYEAAGRQSGAVVIPVGEVWQRALAASLPVPLWRDDGSHPAPAGTYLAACVVYGALFSASPIGLADHEGLPDDVAARLQQIAAGG